MQWVIRRLIHKIERRLGASLPHLLSIGRQSPAAFFKVLLVMPLAAHRSVLSKEACHVARIAALMATDCGGCLQIAVNLALSEGVEATLLRAAVERRVEALGLPAAAAFRFAEAVVRRSPDLDDRRAEVLEFWGEAGLAELSIAVSAATVFPTLRRALGQTTLCGPVRFPQGDAVFPAPVIEADLDLTDGNCASAAWAVPDPNQR